MQGLSTLPTGKPEYSPSASVSSNKMHLKRNFWQTQDSESHCNDDGQSDNAIALASTPSRRKGMKKKRGAHVHNLSEKRQRDKISKRLRVLQNLIPNGTKIGKASVLDEAIEYLKSIQLQLQVWIMCAINTNDVTSLLPCNRRRYWLEIRSGCSRMQRSTVVQFTFCRIWI